MNKLKIPFKKKKMNSMKMGITSFRQVKQILNYSRSLLCLIGKILKMMHIWMHDLQNNNKELTGQLDSIIDELEDNPCLFWVARLGPDDWEIRCKVNIRVCGDYLNGQCTGCCHALHLCKGFCFRFSNYGILLSHN